MVPLKDEDVPPRGTVTAFWKRGANPSLVLGAKYSDRANRICPFLRIEPDMAVLTEKNKIRITMTILRRKFSICTRPFVTRRLNVRDVTDDNDWVVVSRVHD